MSRPTIAIAIAFAFAALLLTSTRAPHAAEAQSAEAQSAEAQSAEAQSAEAQSAEAPVPSEAIGLNLDVGLATAYVFRGWNVFQKRSQMDPHLLLAPGAEWAIGDSGVTLGYWAAYQLTGSNIGANTDSALNVEQDLTVSYDLELGSDVGLTFALLSYIYPAADPDVMGTSVPVYLDPLVALRYATAIDLRLGVSYLVGIQDEPGIRDISYLYLNPSLGKSWELDEHVGLELLLGYGLKIPNEGLEGRDNVHDVTFTAATPIHPGGDMAYFAPGIGLAWTNVEDVVDEDSGEVLDDNGFADGLALWATMNLGMDI